ncbi:2-polyprenyl-6-methoxyphenol hydroxylase-like FAD-dependent oxidoreductase [Homoserinimonas aerilata]|uniref:2-polyprenyl-6-methoxyphenol hydroxylase-like FAD-dependent oxidoreductase n=1 Tax=Homoserinimonas aerilata TaxID=1162970 RepID=A0A542YLA8_9MICO|nr:NAD(P)/FAD-dependent oxidoreductase [Homoserinimonas aerilata]TQL48724.1 2-polyprenyl-6-methoxyphenol hydroxylase-like FAD-dependent oxidoreductase [Homoserinimonas aerilata]
MAEGAAGSTETGATAGPGAHPVVHDVAIVGAGPVGMLLAVLLAQGGRDVVVVDARSEISSRPRAIGIHPSGASALAAAGVDVSLQAAQIRGGVARADGRILGRMEFGSPVFSLPQQEVERMLRDRFEGIRPGSLWLGRRVTGLAHTARGVELLGTGIVARLVVGADGVDSVVRRAAGVHFRSRFGRAHYLMADLPAGGSDEDGAVLFFERGGVVESFPLVGGGRRWVALTPSPVGADGVTLASIVEDRTGAVIPTEGGSSSFTARQRLAESMVADGVVLIGDAAHEISPIGGQGLNLGWLDARALAVLLLREAHPSSASWRRFDRIRRRSARRAAGLAAFNMLVGRPLPGWVHALRTFGIRVLASPPFRRSLADAFTMRRR